MASKIFLDANVLLDFLLQREHYNEAERIIELVLNGKTKAYVTPSIIHIVGHWLTKEYGSEKTKKLILTLLLDISVIDCNHETTLNALHSKINDVEDSLQYYTALQHKVSCFISRDKQLKKTSIPSLPVYTPKEFLSNFS